MNKSKLLFYIRLCLAQTYIEHAKFLPFDDMLENEEKQNEKLKADKACGRIKKEMSNAAMVERKKRNRDKYVIFQHPIHFNTLHKQYYLSVFTLVSFKVN